jgi:hypothetical protein
MFPTQCEHHETYENDSCSAMASVLTGVNRAFPATYSQKRWPGSKSAWTASSPTARPGNEGLDESWGE